MTLSGSSLFSSALSGLSSTFSSLAKGGNNGTLTLEQILNPDSELVNTNNLNSSFVQYLSSNFSNIDKDGDGKISANDMTELMNTISNKGMTYEEIAQLASSGAISASLTETVLTYFHEIDKNGDGRITSSEIAAYSTEADRFEMEKKYNGYNPSSASLFYGDDDAKMDLTSVLDYKYPTKSSSS